MTRRLEEHFNLPNLDHTHDDESVQSTVEHAIEDEDVVSIENAITVSEKINNALTSVYGMDSHDLEMDDIANKALDSYEQLMGLGMNMTDMAAGPVFANAANMLKIALDARDAKVTRKLKQIDLMLKKARLDQKDSQKEVDVEDVQAVTFDRNELLKMISQNKSL